MGVCIINGLIQINQFRTNSAMSQGKNAINDWTMNTKSNITLGQVAGNFNVFPTGAIILYDPDVTDNPIIDNGIKSSFAPAILELI